MRRAPRQEPPAGAADRVAPLRPDDLSGALGLLAEITRAFANSLELQSALEEALASIVRQLRASAGSLWLLEEDGQTLVCRASVGRSPIEGVRLPISQGIIGRSVRENICQTVLDTSQDPYFTNAVDDRTGLVTESLLCAPMTYAERPIGAIEVLNKEGADARFSQEDIVPLQVLASTAALAITNVRMAASAMEHERVRRELELAAEIQRSLLPRPRPAPFPVHGANLPARTVSGDFYDILTLADGRIAFCLGDVSGKGMNAALLMAKTASLYRLLAKNIESPGRLLRVLNDEIAETATRGMFVTMAAGVFEPKTGVILLANAGHEPPLHHTHSGQFLDIPADAPPLGIAVGSVPDAGYPESALRIEEGSLYVFSDGITEAVGPRGEPLGARGLQELIARHRELPLAERVERIIEHVGRLERRDDLTLLAICNEAGCR